jgi:acetyl/propionyl-CoA carboxylase alpha subunit/acetyl-CoA carboxylase carboxyltransferase component
MFTRVVVVNRGEPAIRLIRAVRELNEQRGSDIRVIALHTEAERRAMFVRAADEAVCLRDVTTEGGPYLDHAELERALRASRADAVWVGWGFVAEDPAFAELCEQLGMLFIGPPPQAMRKLGDKIEAKLLAEQSGIPVALWSGGPVHGLEEAVRHGRSIGYPLIIKARSGGGGRGIRVVNTESELEVALERTQTEASRTFGDPVVFLERLVAGARHIEVQLIADNQGTVWAPGVRDCSIQRRNQKLIEESSSPALTAEQEGGLRTAAIALGRAAGYRGVGTVEFLYGPTEKTFAFLEVNTRLQVEHPVTEAVTGLDLVKLQLLVAAGEPLIGEAPQAVGHAIEVRLNAENADQGFAPAPGTVELLHLPSGPGIRVDTGIAAGDVIPPTYDSMVAKIIAWGQDRPEALARLRCALRETTIVIRGGTTTRSFLLDLLDRPEFVSGEADTGWLDRIGTSTALVPGRHADIALLSVAIDVYDAEEALERQGFLASASGGRPRASHNVGRKVELGYQARTYRLEVGQVGPRRYRLVVDAGLIDVVVDRLSDFESRLLLGGALFHIVSVESPSDHLVEVDGVSHRIERDESGVVRSPAPAVLAAVRVAAGEDVEAGAPLAVLESMKMETVVRSPRAGRVREILAAVNSNVEAGAPLVRLDIPVDDARSATAPAVSFKAPTQNDASDALTRARAHLDALRAMFTGYDVTAQRARALVAEYSQLRDELPQDDAELRHEELALLTTFADLCELSRNRPTREEESPEERVHSPQEYFHTYLHSLDVEQESLPAAFRTRLSRVLGHYGVADLTPSPELEEAVFRVFLAQQRAADQIPVVTALLARWLLQGEVSAGPAEDEIGEVLDRLIVATQLRYPTVGDLARSIRFRLFDQPLILTARERVYAGVRQHLGYLDEHPDAADYSERIESVAASPEPLIRILAQRIGNSSAGLEPMIEVLTRRYYKVRTLEDVRSFLRDGRQFVTGAFELRGKQLSLISTMGELSELPAVLVSVADTAAEVSDPTNLVVDLYLSTNNLSADVDSLAATLQEVLSGVPALVIGRRVTVSVCDRSGAQVERFTFRPKSGRMEEERVIRGIHPLIGQLLDLWRLKNFEGTRLPSTEDTYLFRCVSPDNPADERLVALAEVRDVTPLRDSSGHIVAFPAVERTLAACLESIRSSQGERGSKGWLDANRILLYVWPPVDVPLEELSGFARMLAPRTVGAGLEEIMMLARLKDKGSEELKEVALLFSYRPGAGVEVTVTEPPTEPLAPLDEYTQNVQRSRARGAIYPYEIIPMLTRAGGTFTEHDLDDTAHLVPVERAPGQNRAGIVVGLVSTPSARHPEGMVRVALFGDPTKALGSVAEPECALVIAALDLAEEMGVPVEWFALSSGAKISMDSGTENMDWVARALRRLITFTQAGGEVNVVVTGINVGAQPYWNAEATMLMHTKGILIMTPDSAMVLTGKHSLDYSGGVSAEDNFGIGGYDRVMGPNGQAQYWAPNLTAACNKLFAHYDHTYVAQGERLPRRADSSDPRDRDVRSYPHVHPGSDFTTVGDIFSDEVNKERKKPFDIRTVMHSVVDQDHAVLERWAGMADADMTVVLDAHLGGYPVAVLGIESRPIPRRGQFPADGPDQWTAGTLFPQSSKKTARAINAASGNRPLVVLANLSGFDGSPESLRKMQLEYGAEIGRAIVNFDGPIVFCVISRYHGGAFVVFSGVLNDNMEVIAVEGSFASVIGGAPAAAVVFARDVAARTAGDARIKAMASTVAEADDAEMPRRRAELADLRATVRSEKLGEVAGDFEQIHNIERALAVGSVHAIIPARELRPYLIGAVERGIRQTGSDTPTVVAP